MVPDLSSPIGQAGSFPWSLKDQLLEWTQSSFQGGKQPPGQGAWDKASHSQMPDGGSQGSIGWCRAGTRWKEEGAEAKRSSGPPGCSRKFFEALALKVTWAFPRVQSLQASRRQAREDGAWQQGVLLSTREDWKQLGGPSGQGLDRWSQASL